MAKLVINTYNKKSKINKEIYGHFSEHLGRCIYEGLYVGEDSPIPNTKGMRNDVVNALKEMKLPLLRWPGGCFADEYHWKDGIGPKEGRKKMINTHWGGVVEDNSFGTHEFMELCSQLDCEPYINGNVGSGTVQEMQEWIEYMTFDGVSPMAELRRKNGREEPWKVKYFGVGNENWGCGGHMRPEHYADLYRQFQTYIRNFGDNQIYKIACGANVDDYHWTEKIMAHIPLWMFNGISLHYYTIPGDFWTGKGSATDFDEKTWYLTLKKALHMDTLITRHSHIIDQYDPEKRIGLIVDEWGAWYDVEPGTNPGFLYQQNTMRDALIAGISLNVFNKHSDRVKMANIAQLINVLQSVILTDGEKMILTPTYHIFNMYKVHQEAMLLDSFLETKQIGIEEEQVCNLHESVSIDKDGAINITLCNLSLSESASIEGIIVGEKGPQIHGSIVTGRMNAYNTFENPNVVKVERFDDMKLTQEGFIATIPPCSVVLLQIN